MEVLAARTQKPVGGEGQAGNLSESSGPGLGVSWEHLPHRRKQPVSASLELDPGVARLSSCPERSPDLNSTVKCFDFREPATSLKRR